MSRPKPLLVAPLCADPVWPGTPLPGAVSPPPKISGRPGALWCVRHCERHAARWAHGAPWTDQCERIPGRCHSHPTPAFFVTPGRIANYAAVFGGLAQLNAAVAQSLNATAQVWRLDAGVGRVPSESLLIPIDPGRSRTRGAVRLCPPHVVTLGAIGRCTDSSTISTSLWRASSSLRYGPAPPVVRRSLLMTLPHPRIRSPAWW